jgi:hypothetical protein
VANWDGSGSLVGFERRVSASQADGHHFPHNIQKEANLTLGEAVVLMNTLYRQTSSIVSREDKERYEQALIVLNQFSLDKIREMGNEKAGKRKDDN